MRKEYVITIMLLAVLVACSVPISAQYCEDLSIVISGTGDVYVGGGHGLGTSPYQQGFDVPLENVKWARLYNARGFAHFGYCSKCISVDEGCYTSTITK